MIEILIVAWMVCGVAGYGFIVADMQGAFPELAYEDRVKDRIFAGVLALLGPCCLIGSLISADFRKYGWML